MNGVALLVALATVGVDYSWRKTEEGLGEYTIQIEPEIRDLLVAGEEVASEMPAHADSVQRICIRIGNSPARHSAAAIQRFKSLWAGAGRYASADPNAAGGDTQTTILWPSRTNPEQTYAVNYGWQPDQEGKQAYYIQIDPTVLKTLAPGDEIHASIDPAAGKVAQFLVSAGTKQLPRVGGQPAEVTPPTIAPRQQPGTLPSSSSSRSRFTTSDSGTAPAAGSTFGASSRNRDTGTLSSDSPPLIAPRDDGGYGSRFDTATNPASDPRASAYEPEGRFNDLRAGDQRGTLQPPTEYQPAQSPFIQPVGGQQPQYNQPQQPPQYSQPPQYTSQPPQYSQPPPQQYQPPPTTSYSPPATDRLASVPPPVTTGATAPPRIAPLEAPAPTLPGTPAGTTNSPSGTLWFVVIMALFMSIGANAYLGWTAAEFYQRYRTAVDRLRSAARA